MKALFCAFHANDRLLRLIDDFPQLSWAVAMSPDDVCRFGRGAEIVVLNNRICDQPMGTALRDVTSDTLRWIHFVTAGVERGAAIGLPTGIPVTNAAGLNAPALAEHAMLLLLSCLRQLNAIIAAQSAREWRRLDIVGQIVGLEDACVCIVGLGAVGRAIAKRLNAFGARVIAVSREGTDVNVSEVFARHDLCAALSIADAVILCTNADRTSNKLLGEPQFNVMKPSAVIINIARGELLDEQALIQALVSRRIAAAGLDVTASEPLDPGSSLWNLPQVILSPHVAGGGSGEPGYRRQSELFAANLARLAQGLELKNTLILADHKIDGSSQ